MTRANGLPPEAGPDEVDLHVGRMIRLARKEAQLSQEELAGACGITFQQIQKYERGANRVSASMLLRIATKLGRMPGWFFEGAPGLGGVKINTFDPQRELLKLTAMVPGVLEALRALEAMTPNRRRLMVDLMEGFSQP